MGEQTTTITKETETKLWDNSMLSNFCKERILE
jgi:hypothetical protein